jgi:two-component system, OmpR family, phosphate regulon response regulator OmpR
MMPCRVTAPRATETMAGCIWILDDDADLGSLLLEQFAQRGWQARHLQHPRELDQALSKAVPDMLVLDELLPGQRGTDILLRLRQEHPQLPVLMLSALGAPRDRIAGLEAGANDYLGKPFLFRELQLRVEQLLRAVQSPQPPDQAWQLGELRLDPQQLWIGRRNGQGLELSRGDVALLQLLCNRAGEVVSRQELGQASGSLVDPQQSRSIDVRLSRLRRLLLELQPEEQMIETVRGQGYRLTAPVRRLPASGG